MMKQSKKTSCTDDTVSSVSSSYAASSAEISMSLSTKEFVPPKSASRLWIFFDQMYFYLCCFVVNCSIVASDVPLISSLLRRLTLMSGSFDTNANLCLFLRYLYTFLPHPLAIDKEEIVFAHMFLEVHYFVCVWLATRISYRLLPPLIRPLYISYFFRAKFSSEFVERCMSERGVRQIVILGAGYDSTAYRTRHARLRRSVRVFEVDLPRVQRYKVARMQSKLSHSQFSSIVTGGGTVFVECDFSKDRLVDVLIANGFDSSQPTAVVWEGVTYYLEQVALDETFRELQRLGHLLKQGCAGEVEEDSSLPIETPRPSQFAGCLWLFFDYMHQEATVKKGQSPDRDMVWRLNYILAEKLGTPFRTGLSDIETYLAKHNMQIIRHLTYKDLEQSFLMCKDVPTVFSEPNSTQGVTEPHLNLVECVM